MDSFDDDFFEDGDINFEDCFVGNCCDPRYQMRELPDSLFSQADLTRNVDDLYILNDEILNGLNVSRMGLMEVTKDKITMVCGPKDVEQEEKIFIKPDYTPAIQVLKYSFALDAGREEKFPSILPANPEIPKTGLAQTPSTLPLEEIMAMNGALIYNPSYAFKAKNENTNYVDPAVRKVLIQQILEKLQPNSFVFSARSDISFMMSKMRYMCLQFNPFHPAAVHYLDPELDDDGRVVKGWYHWGRQRRRYRFDRHSKLYRVHSDVWLGLLSREYHYLSVFDIVGNFDLMPYLRGIDARVRTRYVHSSPYCIEHYKTDRESLDLYSSISAPRGTRYYMSYAQTFSIDRKMTYTEYYKDVTEHYELRLVATVPYEINVYHKETGQNIMQIMKGKNRSRYKGSGDHFVQYSSYKHKFFVYEKSSEPTEHEFVRINEFLFGDFPRNSEAVLLRPFHEITLKDYLFMHLQRMSDNIVEKACVEMSGQELDKEELETIQCETDPADIVSAFLNQELWEDDNHYTEDI